MLFLLLSDDAGLDGALLLENKLAWGIVVLDFIPSDSTQVLGDNEGYRLIN